jgi:adenylate cyclase
MARRAAELGKEDAFSLAFAGFAFALVGRQPEHGAALADRAIELNPNLALAWGFCGWARLMLGEHDTAIDRAMRAMRLSPLDPFMRGPQMTMAVAHLVTGRYDEAVSWAAKALQLDPNFAPLWRMTAAAHGLAGNVPEAQAACARLRELEPLLRISNLRDFLAPYRPADLAKYEEGLRKAGLPE